MPDIRAERRAGVLVWPDRLLVKTNTIPLTSSRAHFYQLRTWLWINDFCCSAWAGSFAFGITYINSCDFLFLEAAVICSSSSCQTQRLWNHLAFIAAQKGPARPHLQPSSCRRGAGSTPTPSFCWTVATGATLPSHSLVCAQQGRGWVLCPNARTPAHLHSLSVPTKCSEIIFFSFLLVHSSIMVLRVLKFAKLYLTFI